jgi:hypothetical protein
LLPRKCDRFLSDFFRLPFGTERIFPESLAFPAEKLGRPDGMTLDCANANRKGGTSRKA